MNIPEIEKSVLAYWEKIHAFEKTLEMRKNARPFVFFEGPPTANGRPGIHHVFARAFKDAFCRYKTMRGYRVLRKAGWDTHGLPVELEVEKELGLKNKRDIEKFGIAKFNARCRSSVWKYKADWEDLTRIIGFWLDMQRPYITYETPYMESVWWILKRIWEKGLLYRDYKVVPFCPRCETGLSSHEVALGYKNIQEPSIYIKFEIKESAAFTKQHKIKEKVFLLVWTTTPWTLPGNAAVAINPDIVYVLVKQNGEAFILAKERVGILVGTYEITREFKGKVLVGLEYTPLFSFFPLEKKAHRVIAGDFVSLEEGTGLVHIAPAFGEEDMGAGKENNLPLLMSIHEDGTFRKEVTPWHGLFVKDADPQIIQYLNERRALYKEELYAHDYPFCWRCDSPLLYVARESWFIRMTKVKQELIRNNKTVNWVPAHLKEGRFGEWLRELKDWALSRQRYWGTPLPIWVCDLCGEKEVIGSRADLVSKTYSTNRYFILRHAEATSNIQKITSGMPEKDTFSLTLRGRKQAAALVKKIKTMKIDYIYTSDLKRTKETAAIIGDALKIPIRIEKGLREYQFGDFNLKPLAEFEKAFPTLEERFDRAPRGGETSRDIKKRVLKTVGHIDSRHEDKTILIVSHGDPLWLLEGALCGMSQRELVEFHNRSYIKKAEVRSVPYTRLPYNDEGEVDFHRPYIDEVAFSCHSCSGNMKRVPDLIDVWFDSGAMPFAQSYWPFDTTQGKFFANAQGKLQTNKKSQKLNPPALFPADYICEAMDQTRGWFYTLLAISTVLGYGAPYKNVISVGWVLDRHGKKMSKSRGNIVNPWDIVKTYGVDSLRWYFFTINQPGEPKLFDEKDVKDRLNRFIMTYWNTFTFFETYATRDARESKLRAPSSHVLDRWILARLTDTIRAVTEFLDQYDIVGAARILDAFVDDISNWYVRRSRRRFQKPKNLEEKTQALHTLGFVLLELAKLSSPFIPFIAEESYRRLARHYHEKSSVALGSIHFADWPKPNSRYRNKKILSDMKMVRNLVSLGFKARKEAEIKVRQPLATFFVQGLRGVLSKNFQNILMDELNVKEIRVATRIPSEDHILVVGDEGTRVGLDTRLTRKLKEEGTVREIIRILQDMRKDAGYKPAYKIFIFFSGEVSVTSVLNHWEDTIRFEVGAKKLRERDPDHHVFDVERELAIDGRNLWLGITKIKS